MHSEKQELCEVMAHNVYASCVFLLILGTTNIRAARSSYVSRRTVRTKQYVDPNHVILSETLCYPQSHQISEKDSAQFRRFAKSHLNCAPLHSVNLGTRFAVLRCSALNKLTTIIRSRALPGVPLYSMPQCI